MYRHLYSYMIVCYEKIIKDTCEYAKMLMFILGEIKQWKEEENQKNIELRKPHHSWFYLTIH